MRISDWSSDVCSSDLMAENLRHPLGPGQGKQAVPHPHEMLGDDLQPRLGQQEVNIGHPAMQGIFDRNDGTGGAAFDDAVDRILERKAWKRQPRSEEHTSELQSLMRISYAVFCLK